VAEPVLGPVPASWEKKTELCDRLYRMTSAEGPPSAHELADELVLLMRDQAAAIRRKP
jgi:hypothetical protein